MIAIVNYGVGNLFSLCSSLQALGFEAKVTGQTGALAAADKIILPGVGAFADAMQKLETTGLAEEVKRQVAAGKPLLGICLGMQLLFEQSHEFGVHRGLGLISGEIFLLSNDLQTAGFAHKVPHIGWNPLQLQQQSSPLLRYTKEGDSVYYVHSYHAKFCEADTIAFSEYGIRITGAVQKNNVFGTQFHPEKSGRVGLAMLKAFAEG